jgi:hypothetical protein
MEGPYHSWCMEEVLEDVLLVFDSMKDFQRCFIQPSELA